MAADARAALERLGAALQGYRVDAEYADWIASAKREWEAETDRIYGLRHGPPISQGEVIGIVNRAVRPDDVLVNAAGSLPGDLHKLWRTAGPAATTWNTAIRAWATKSPAGWESKWPSPRREVYVMVGDGSFLMMFSEIATSVQEGCKLNIVVLDNHGFSSIGGLSQAIGSGGFGTDYRLRREESGALDGAYVPVDFVALAAGMGARAVRARTHEELAAAVEDMRRHSGTSVVVVEVDKEMRVPGYESWWDVPDFGSLRARFDPRGPRAL